jgi:hypothetical protein
LLAEEKARGTGGSDQKDGVEDQASGEAEPGFALHGDRRKWRVPHFSPSYLGQVDGKLGQASDFIFGPLCCRIHTSKGRSRVEKRDGDQDGDGGRAGHHCQGDELQVAQRAGLHAVQHQLEPSQILQVGVTLYTTVSAAVESLHREGRAGKSERGPMQPAFCGANPIVSSPRHVLALSRCKLCCVALENSVMPHQDPVPRGTLRDPHPPRDPGLFGACTWLPSNAHANAGCRVRWERQREGERKKGEGATFFPPPMDVQSTAE